MANCKRYGPDSYQTYKYYNRFPLKHIFNSNMDPMMGYNISSKSWVIRLIHLDLQSFLEQIRWAALNLSAVKRNPKFVAFEKIGFTNI